MSINISTELNEQPSYKFALSDSLRLTYDNSRLVSCFSAIHYTTLILQPNINSNMQSSIVHYSVIQANNQDLLSKSNNSLYCFQVCSIIFQMNTLDSFILIVKKPKYPFSLFSALFEETNQNLVKTEGINSIKCIETEPI